MKAQRTKWKAGTLDVELDEQNGNSVVSINGCTIMLGDALTVAQLIAALREASEELGWEHVE